MSECLSLYFSFTFPNQLLSRTHGMGCGWLSTNQGRYFVQYLMLAGLPVGKKVLQRREQERLLQGHMQRVRRVRPSTTGYDWYQAPRLLNNGKRQMLQQDKFTEIERENRLLLEKITHNMNKRVTRDEQPKDRMNKSLHSSFRKKQLQNIEVENARLLKRLQEKKSDYQTQKLNEDWKKQKVVIRNIANYPIIIRDGSKREKRRAFSRGVDLRPSLDRNSLGGDIELMRIRNIDGVNMVITIKLNESSLVILSDLRKGKDIKIIEIPREEAMEFIEAECEGKIEGLFDRLHFDKQQEVLYLLSQEAEMAEGQPVSQVDEI